MCATLIRLCTCLGLLFISLSSFSAIEVHDFDNDVDRQRYQTFIDEMRCPKCQNQNLAGTNSPIAVDLRHELELMIKAGKSDKEIIEFMVDRYGEFILYRPRLSSATLLLWVTPVALLVFGVIMLLLIVRKRRRLDIEANAGLSSAERERLNNLLNASSDKDSTELSTEHSAKKSNQENK